MTERIKSTSEILALYADGPALLASAVAGLTASDLDASPAADSWSIRQIVHHIADGDDIWKICIKAALGNNDGEFALQWYWDKPQLEWSVNWKYASRDIESSLAILRANRHHIVELISLTPGAWERSLWLKPPRGRKERISVGWIIEMQAMHVVGHIKDIRSILQAYQNENHQTES